MKRYSVHQIQLSMFFLLLTTPIITGVEASDWPRFRGPHGDGASNDPNVPLEWGDGKNIKWKVAMPGKGFSSPIVVGDKVLITASSGSEDQVQRHLVCVHRDTGSVLWKKSVPGVSDGGDGGFAYHGQASHTPVSDGENVYVMFGSGGVVTFDLSGKELWKQAVGNERASRFGTASSPILYNELVIVTAGAESESIRAFDRKSGEEVWKTEARSLSGTYSTPIIGTNSMGEDELVISVTSEVWGLNPKNGDFKWYAETQVDTAACPSVIIDKDIAYVIGGRRGGRAAVRLGGEDDVTESHVLWSESGGSYVPSPVLYEGNLYWINDSGIASCVDTKTGKEVNRKRLGGKYYASLLLVQDKLYAVSRFDGTRVFKASPEFEELAHNTLSDESDFSGSPAVSNGQLLMRSEAFLHCIAKESE